MTVRDHLLGDVVDSCAKRLLEASGDETWEDATNGRRDYWASLISDVLDHLVVDDTGELRDGRWMERARDAEAALDKTRGALVASEAAFGFVKLYKLLADTASENYALLAMRMDATPSLPFNRAEVTLIKPGRMSPAERAAALAVQIDTERAHGRERVDRILDDAKIIASERDDARAEVKRLMAELELRGKP